jgi:hypothetical protein
MGAPLPPRWRRPGKRRFDVASWGCRAVRRAAAGWGDMWGDPVAGSREPAEAAGLRGVGVPTRVPVMLALATRTGLIDRGRVGVVWQ